MRGSTNQPRPNLRAQWLQRSRTGSLSTLAALHIAATIALTFLFLLATRAEQLPLRRYTTADGLASNSVTCVKRDSHGFLWFCTAEGLSRFDGYTFVNYGVEQGLPDRFVTDLIETSLGEYWVATLRGLVQFNPKPAPKEPMFVLHRLGETEAVQVVHALLADRRGDIWAATGGGVFLLTKADDRWVSRRVEFPSSDGSEGPIMEDHAGNIWIALGGPASTLWRRRPGGELEQLAFPKDNKITSLLEDHQGRIWASTYHGLALLANPPRPNQAVVARMYGTKDGLSQNYTCCMFQSSDGRLWVGSGAVFEVLSHQDGKDVRFRFVGRGEQGFFPIEAEDVQGNLWMASTRIAAHGFVTYGRRDGLVPKDIRSIFEGQDGELYIVTGVHSRYLHRFNDGRFTTVQPLIPGYEPSKAFFWGWGQIHFQDHMGEWWIGTERGLLRYPRVARLEDLARTRPLAAYTERDGLNGNEIWRLYEDSRGDIWISAWGGSGMTKWERTTGRFHVFTEADGWKSGLSSSFREDHFGNIWIGLGDGLARFRGGRFTYFTPAQGYPALGVVSMFVDHAGQLWVGTRNNGLVRLPDPGADHPQFVTYTASGGVSSNEVRAITEDHWGRIYFWTGRGVDRLEPTTGAIRHYTEADGLVMSGSDHSVAFSDRHGHLWFGADGLSRLDPEPDDPNPAPPPVRITGVRIRGIAYSVSDLGETNLSGLILDPDQNAIEIDFAGFNFGVGQVLRYQYKLEGTDHDWSPLTELRTVNYAKLRPGSYRFLVRTVNAEGIVSSSPALFTFRLLAPVWQRWWFLSLLAVTLGLIIYLGHRYRMAQVLTVERIRTRIASDLHDDVGAGLSQIAILSEVVKRETRPDGSEAGALLDHMAELSRNLVDSMGEIVWAISPRRDSLEALVQRMRRFASDVLAPRSIEFEFRVPSMDHDSSLGADVRRQVFLVFKEAVNNSARHAGCSRVSVALAFEKDALELIISDNGCGLNPTAERNGHSQGHGIESIRHRAAEMGGHMEISSGQGTGTRIDLRVPLTRRPFFSFRHKITT